MLLIYFTQVESYDWLLYFDYDKNSEGFSNGYRHSCRSTHSDILLLKKLNMGCINGRQLSLFILKENKIATEVQE